MDDRRALFEGYEEKLEKILRDGQDISYADLEYEIRQVIWFFKTLYSNEDYKKLFTPSQWQDIESNIAQQFIKVINSITEQASWNISNPNVSQRFNTWRQQIEAAHRRLIEQNYLTRLQSAIALNSSINAEAENKYSKQIEHLIKEQAASLNASEEQAAKTLVKIAESQTEVERALKRVNATAEKAEKSLAKQVKSTQGQQLLKDSENYGKTASKWLKAQITIASIIALIIGVLLVQTLNSPEAITGNIVLSGLKLTLIALGIYLIQIAGRNYAANKHLQTLNRQRATVLAFINEFVSSVEEPEYKDYLLTYAAKTVFEHGESGFITKNYGAGSNEESGLESLLNTLTRNK